MKAKFARVWSCVSCLMLLAVNSVQTQPQNPAAPLTLNVSGQTVEELLQQLNAPGRPELKSKPPIASQCVTVFARKQSPVSVMNGLKTLFDAVWIDTSPDPAKPHFLLSHSRRSAEYEQELYRLTLERGAEPMFRLTEYLKTSEEDFARQQKQLQDAQKEPDDPLLKRNLFYLARSGPRLGLNLLGSLSPEQRFALLSEGQYLLSQNAMTQRQRRMTRGMAQAAGILQEKIGRLAAGETPDEQAQFAERFGLILEARVHPVTGAFTDFSYSSGVGGLFVAITDNLPPPKPILPVRGNPYRFRADRKVIPPVYRQLQQMLFPSKFRLEKGNTSTWRDVLTELAEHLSIPLYSDDFRYTTTLAQRLSAEVYPDEPKEKPHSSFAALAKRNLQEGLDALCDPYGYLWWYQNGAVFFRSRTWFIEQQYEVPSSVLALVQNQLKTEGKLNAKGVTALSTLTKKQLVGLSGLIPPDNGEKREYARINSEKAWNGLQIYMRLNEEEKHKVFSGGMSFLQMNRVAQQEIFLALYAGQNLKVLNEPEKIRLQVWHKDSALARVNTLKCMEVGFTLGVGGWSGSITIPYEPSITKPIPAPSVQRQ